MPSVRTVPRISLNKLGEYMNASASRRKRIIAEQREPKTFIIARYTDAQDVICNYLQDDSRDDEILYAGVERLLSAPVTTEWEEQCNQLCALALQHFLKVKDALPLAGCSCEVLSPEQSSLMIVAGVEISVRPEVSLSIMDGKKAGQRGAIKLAFSKTYKLGEKSGEYISTLLHEYAITTLFKGEKVCNDKCLLVDVFDGQVISAPSARKRRMDDINAACEEIRKIW